VVLLQHLDGIALVGNRRGGRKAGGTAAGDNYIGGHSLIISGEHISSQRNTINSKKGYLPVLHPSVTIAINANRPNSATSNRRERETQSGY